MGGGTSKLEGPDLKAGVKLGELKDGASLLGHADGEAVLLVRQGDAVHALGATCTHYGGPLAEGLVADGKVHCPWHHACFDLKTGQPGAPALHAVPCYEVVRDGELVKIGGKRELPAPAAAAGPESVVIVGGGAAGAACAQALRREGYAGSITLLGEEGPVDRPNLSKDYLAGNAPEEWMPLFTDEALAELGVHRVRARAKAFDAAAHMIEADDGRSMSWGALVLATGAEPVRLPIEGANLPHVHLLRTLADSRAIIAALAGKRRAVVIGSSFIGLEAAASLRQRGLEVTVVGPDQVPLGRILGEEVGKFVRKLHEDKGVVFRLGHKPARITPEAVELDDGTQLPAELVVMGVGVRPRVALAEAAGLRVDNGVIVDASLKTSVPDVYAIGDIARFPYDGGMVRIEHWQVAERQGQALARTLVGRGAPFADVPFFWSMHYDVQLSYVGHVERFDAPEIRGDLGKRDAVVAYRHEGRIRAVLTVGRDKVALAAEQALRRGDQQQLAALLT